MESQIIFQLLTMAFYALNGVLISSIRCLCVDTHRSFTQSFAHIPFHSLLPCVSFSLIHHPHTQTLSPPKSDTDFETIFATISTTMAVRCIVPSKNMLTLLIIYPRSFYCSLLSTCHAICTQRYMLRFSRIV